MSTRLTLAHVAHQATLEHLRTARAQDAPAEVVAQLEEDERRARQEMEVAWLTEHFAGTW